MINIQNIHLQNLHRVRDMLDPILDQDAATKFYVDNAVSTNFNQFRSSYDYKDDLIGNGNAGSLLTMAVTTVAGGNYLNSFGEATADGVRTLQVFFAANSRCTVLLNSNAINNIKDCSNNRGCGFRVKLTSTDTPTDKLFFFCGYMVDTAIPLSAQPYLLGFLYDPTNVSGLNPSLYTKMVALSKDTATVTTVNTGYTMTTNIWHEFYIVYTLSLARADFYAGDVPTAPLTTVANIANALLPQPELTTLYKVTPGITLRRGTVNVGTGNRDLRLDYIRIFKDWL